ncbi:MAG: cell surface protein SprA [Saprospiraceae bacterium]|nr:cell surface protein SprA [Saprospiraceae bacterium]
MERITFIVGFTLLVFWNLVAGGHQLPDWEQPSTVSVQDTIPLKDRPGNFVDDPKDNPFDLKDPKVIDQKIEYDPETGEYNVSEKIGDDYYRPSSNLTFTEFLNFKARQQDQEYLKNLAGISTTKRNYASIVDPISKIDLKKNLADRLFGGFGIDIKPQGSIGFTLGANYSYTANPQIPERQRRQLTPDFDMDIRMDVTGNIGDKLKLNTNYDTKAAFDFENKLKLAYDSEKFSEDDIIKKIEAGNVSLPLRTNLIQGSQNLFGFKTDWQFGHLRLTGLISQQKSKQENIQTKGGGVFQEYEVRPDQYDENRHFFLSHYNRNSYEIALANLPEINSQFKIKNIEVWLTEDAQNSRETELRDIVALNDLGVAEAELFDMGITSAARFLPGSAVSKDKSGALVPSNTSNTLLDQILINDQARDLNKVVRYLSDPNGLNLKQGRDFEKVRAKRLSPNEYSYNAELGFISLRSRPRPNQVLAVSYQYLQNGREIDPRTGAIYKVGEMSSDVKSDSLSYKVIFVKMLKSSGQRTDLPSYKLMMKNVYPTGGFNLNQDDFTMDLYYEDQDGIAKRYIQEIDGYPLLNLFNMDFLNKTNDPQPDGVFDFIPGQTVIPPSGAVIFPVLEPFGSSFKKLLAKVVKNPTLEDAIYKKYNYESLYDTSITAARRDLKSNQFLIKGSYKSGKSNEIPLNTFNLDPNARVIVSAGSLTLNEGSDYIVDRNLGKVTILNEALLQSGVPINVKFEDNSLFSFQTKTMIGLRAEYSKRKDLSIGATYMHLFEKPFTEKVNIGEDPINNRVVGLDFNINRKAPWMTRFLDKLPLYSTKEASSWTLQAEAAALIPGHSKAINQQGSEGGVVYIDDFEGSSSGIGLGYNVSQWILASAPQGLSDPSFAGSDIYDNVISNANRALVSWYRIDEYARTNTSSSQNSYTRLVDETEIFPNKQRPIGFSTELTFDISYYPKEKGPYNFDVNGGLTGTDINGNTVTTFGIDGSNKLLSPETRWGGLMTRLNTNDFEANNVEYIDFWMLNPFLAKPNPNDPVTNSGKMYFQLGNFSEDILKDGKQQFEHGLPTTSLNLPVDYSVFGKIARVPPLTSSFDVNDREQQDLGYDGLNSSSNIVNKDEAIIFSDYISKQKAFLDPRILPTVINDPANDDYVSYRSNSFTGGETVLDKYKRYNMPEGNGQIETDNNQSTAYTGYPDQEDLNYDKSLNEIESYYNYEIPIERTPDFKIAFDPSSPTNYITDTVIVRPANSNEDEVWYRFRIPVKSGKAVGQINDFRSILSMRILFAGFDQSVTFRLIKFQLGRNSWRKYKDYCTGIDDGNKSLILDKVDIEENSGKTPFNYKTPPGIQRERFYSTQYADIQQNESSLLLRKEDLLAGCENSIYKILDLDIRKYKRIKMFVHGESIKSENVDKVCVFMRLGKDFTNNYYEYEIPLAYSDKNFPADQDSIWLKRNDFDFPLQLLVDLKNKRDNDPSGDLATLYEISDPERPDNKVTVIGNPTIGLVRGALLGVRNKNTATVQDIEVWFNELRLTGLEEKGGFAALARAEIQLADLGNVSLAGNFSTVGWGGIDQKLAQRATDETKQIDATVNLALDKFIPEKIGIRLPFSAQVSHITKTPEYDPNHTDIKLKDRINSATTEAKKDSIRDQAIDYTDIKSFAFNNVRKERKGSSKPKPWDIENFSLSYAQSVSTKHNPIIALDKLKSQQGGIDYNFALTPKYIEPFKKLITNKNLKLLGEFNFNLIPNSFSVRNGLDRKNAVRTYRFAAPKYSTWEDRKFSWNRDYSLAWDFTKSLKFNFSARNEAAVDEITYNPLRQDCIDPITGLAYPCDERSKYVAKNLRNFGRTKDYKHNFTLAYAVPTRLIPFLDFVTIRTQYTANYNWSAGSLNSIDSLGSVISNGQNISITNELNFTTLYNKSKFLRKYSGEGDYSGRFRPAAKTKESAKPEDGDKSKKKKETSEKVDPLTKIALTPILMLKRIQLNFSQNRTTSIPGFMEKSNLLGMSKNFTAPGWDFIAGNQVDFGKNGWLDRAAEKGWISTNCYFNKEMIQRKSNTIGAKIKLEPFKDFSIDLNLDRSYTKDLAETFKLDSVFGTNDMAFQHFTPFENGQYSISYVSLQTIFSDLDAVFERFSKSRPIISKRVADRLGVRNLSPFDPNYYDGFQGDHIDVVSPAFLAAYTNKDPNSFNLDLFNTFPLPNWQINYTGLSRLGVFKDIFQDFSIRHGYKNTLTVNSFRTNLDYRTNNNELPISRRGNELKASYHSKYEVPEMVINEQFAPLLGINIKAKNGIELGLDLNKNRNLKLQNGIEGQLLETKATNYTIKAGYVIKDVIISWLPGMKALNKGVNFKKKKSKSKSKQTEEQQNASTPKGNDLEFTFDFGITDNITKIHRLDVNIKSQPISGAKQISFTPAVKYSMNKNLNVRLFCDYRKTIPYVQNQYKDVRINGGLTIMYTLN